jgi:hypothetical protein
MTKTEASPPYVRFHTLKAFLVRLGRQARLPSRVDGPLLSALPSTTRVQLPAALRFLGLADEDHAPSPSLRRLVAATKSEPTWQREILAIVRTRYRRVLGDLDPRRTSTSVVTRRLAKRTRLRGTTLRKAVRFYVVALRDAGAEISPRLGARVRSGESASPVRRARQSRDPRAAGVTQQILLRGKVRGFIRLPEAYDHEDIEAARSALHFLAASAVRR